MKILAASTSSDVLSVCVAEDGRLLGKTDVCLKRRHSVLMLPVIDELMKLTGTDITDIGLFVCDTGPGSFTGIRIGAGTLNAMALATGKPALGVPSLDILAYGVSPDGGYASSMIYARNDQLYGALYRDAILAGDYFAGSAEDYLEAVAGLADGKVIFVGDGSLAFRDKITARFAGRASFAAADRNMLNSYALACIASLSGPGDGYIRPFYMKKSSAREKTLEKHV